MVPNKLGVEIITRIGIKMSFKIYFFFSFTTLHFHIVQSCFINKIEERDFCFVVKVLRCNKLCH